MGLLALYVSGRLVWRRPWPYRVKWAICLALVASSQHHLITRSFFGSMASPEVPGWILMFLGWAFGSMLITACLFFVVDVLGGVVSLLSRRAGRALLDSRSALRPSLALAVAALSVAGVWQAVRVPDVRTVEITLPALPPAFDGFRVVQLTDLHASRLLRRPWMEAVVGKANALEPDLIVLTGDMVDGTTLARADDVEPLRRLTAGHGVFAIPGNHEYYEEYQPWIHHFESLGLRMLLNEHVAITNGDASIALAGITDPAAARFGMPMPDIQGALAGLAPEDPVILLSHRPPGARRNADAGVNLQLSGHTHGGQVWGLHWITQWANGGYVSGLYTVGDMRLFVSNGAGLWNGFPVRLGRPSEITQIVLRAGGPSIPQHHEKH